MAYKKYMFDLDFGPPSAASRQRQQEAEQAQHEYVPEPEPDLPPPPTFTEEDLQVVREAAYEEGHRAGLNEGMESTEHQMAEAMSRLAEAMASLHGAQEDSADANQRVAARVAMAVLKKVLPAACEQVGLLVEQRDGLKVRLRGRAPVGGDLRGGRIDAEVGREIARGHRSLRGADGNVVDVRGNESRLRGRDRDRNDGADG